MRSDPYGHCALLLAALAAGCTSKAPEGAAPAANPTPTVSVVQPEKKVLARVVEQPGTVEAFEETHLFAKLAGYVGAIAVDPARKDRPERARLVDIGSRVTGPKYDADGREVTPGQVLVEIAIPELHEEAKQKEALVRQAEAEVEQSRKGEGAAAAGVDAAQATFIRWESEAKRVAEMVRTKVVNPQAGDETENQFRSAEAALRKAKADREKAKADTDAAQARLEVAKADVRRTQALLGYTKIRAPYDGIVTHRGVNLGDFVQPGVGKTGLLTVARLDPLRVVVHVPEADAGQVREGAEVKLTFPAEGGPGSSGVVSRTSWALATGSRTLRAEIDVPYREGGPRPGTYVYARITIQEPPAWVVPVSALARQGDATVAYLIVDGKAMRTPVQTGRTDGKQAQVLRLRRPGAADWESPTGQERFASPAANVTDGQEVR